MNGCARWGGHGGTMQDSNTHLPPAAHGRATDERSPDERITAVIEGTRDLLARIGGALDADVVVLHRHADSSVTTVASWRRVASLRLLEEPVPANWFPWNLGNLHAAEHVFVRNAGRLRPHPGSAETLGDLGAGSAVHLAVRAGTHTLGGVCAYWSAERERWDHADAAAITELARRALELSPPHPLSP